MEKERTLKDCSLEELGETILELVLKNDKNNKYYSVDLYEYSKDNLISIGKEYIKEYGQIDSSELIGSYTKDSFEKLSAVVQKCTREYNNNYLYNNKDEAFYKTFILSSMAKFLIENKMMPFSVKSNHYGDYIDMDVNGVPIEIRVCIARYVVESGDKAYMVKTVEEVLEKINELSGRLS